ncbi:MAG: hypothetical protein N2316_11905, partial [Spirochaetes bacterium]|nr:hypothetical protein [Spirochaetota bacterium]
MHRLFSIANEISMAFGIFVFLFFINTKLKAEGNSTSMAFVTSVVSDYSFDAMRNPALLGLHNSRYSVGFFIGSGPHATVDVDVYDSNMKFDSMSEFIVQSGAAFVYTTKSYAIGLAISNISQENLYKSSESELALHAYLEDAKADIEASATVAEKIYAPAIYIAMAFPIAHTLFFGIQGNAGIKRKNLKQHVDGTIFFSIPQYIHSDFHSQMKEYIFEAGAGLLKKLERGHVGLFLRSGKISSSTVKGEYLASFVPEQHQQATNPLRYVSGMSLVAGFYIRPLELFGCAIESGYRFPAEYRDNTISEGDGSLQEQAYLQHVGERYDLKAAFEWLGIAPVSYT